MKNKIGREKHIAGNRKKRKQKQIQSFEVRVIKGYRVRGRRKETKQDTESEAEGKG